VVGGVLGLLALLPMLKLIGVQVSDSDELVAKGEDQRVRRVELPAQRGSILDRNGVELAISIPRQRVVTNMARLREEGIEDTVDLQQLAQDLAPMLGVDRAELAEILTTAEPDDPWVRLAETVPERDALAAVEQLAEHGLVNVLTLEESTERVHPAGESALRLIGNLGPDGPGDLAGVEKAYDRELTGRDGRKIVELGTEGETIAGAEHMVREPSSGSDVHLTLDRTLQHEVERIVADGTAAAGGTRGIAIIGRPATGEILAAGSVERDPETGEMQLSDAPIAVSNAYQAGSVFKLVTVAAAVEAGQVAPDTQIEVPWRIVVDDRTFSDHEEHATEPMSVTDIVADSSNVGTIKIAQGLGKQGLYDALVGFGFGSATGIGHPAESTGLLPPLDQWTNPDLAASAIGTHQSATALQLWAAYNVIANDGRYVQPRLVDSITSPDGTRTPVESVEPRQVISARAAQAVSDMLQEVVRDGTGKALDLPGYDVAAKTGTSRMVSPEKVNTKDAYMWADGRYHYVAAFTGFLPADRPQVSITVIIEDSSAGLTGATAAGPVFGDLAKLSIRELGIAPAGSTRPASGSGPVRAAPAAAAGAPTGGAASDDGASSAAGSGDVAPDEEDEQ
jgi:cell division protein FtsI (penicillin-binding protein 3)